ncbi:MAG: hypothetical protein IJO11_03080 [Alphaproteobacteria bacterium]|nr:hypothetical protein [Alphaproteobacteria bacterium]
MKKNESGRSMVEMLGVLAIIGVLSVGGIAGYTMAMNRYRANEVVDMANKYAVIAYSAYMTNKMMNNGTVSGDPVPSFASTGLFGTNTSVNGTHMGDATTGKGAMVKLDDDTWEAVNTNGTDDAQGVAVTLTFADKKTCQAAATSLGIPVGGGASKSSMAASGCGAEDGSVLIPVFKQS